MGLWSRITSWFGPRSFPPLEAPGWRVLRHLSLDEIFVAWAQREGGDLAGMWTACPRADWLITLSASVGVERRAVFEAVSDCVEQAPRAGGDHAHRAALAAAERWLERQCDAGQLGGTLARFIDEVLDSHPELSRARVARHAPVGRRYPEERISADLAERNVLLQMAGLVRRRISFEDVRDAIWGAQAGDAPYR